MNVAELFVKCLENEGVKYIFGVPGEENEDFLFALQYSDIEFIPTRHEQGAAFMADLWGRLTGKAGVCLATLGPGATNLITGVADAYLDKAPLVAITGQGSLSRLHHESHQVIDVLKMFEPITKWNGSITNTTTILEIVRKAFKVAEAEKPGATHIELPEDIAAMNIGSDRKPLKVINPRRPAPDNSSINQAISILSQANKPIILAGNGAIRNRSSKELRAFAQNFNIPIASTFMGKGSISDKEPQSLGAIGLGFKDYVIEAFEEADVVFCVGYDVAEYNPSQWNTGKPKKIIHLDFEPAEVYDLYIPDVEIVADLAESLSIISKQFKNIPFDSWFEPIRKRIFDSIDSFEFRNEGEEFHVPGVINEVRKFLSEDGLVISDVGSHKMWIARNFKTYCPNGCIISNGLATMGIALPGAISAKLVNSNRQVVAMMGDGGALMNIQELETAVRLGIGATIIIFNDNNYGLIEWKQEMHSGKSFGTKLGNPDFVALAESFSIKGYKPKNVNELRKILSHVIPSNQLNVIEIPITTTVNNDLTETLQNYYKTKT